MIFPKKNVKHKKYKDGPAVIDDFETIKNKWKQQIGIIMKRSRDFCRKKDLMKHKN